jgi:hypothetical protein
LEREGKTDYPASFATSTNKISCNKIFYMLEAIPKQQKIVKITKKGINIEEEDLNYKK